MSPGATKKNIPKLPRKNGAPWLLDPHILCWQNSCQTMLRVLSFADDLCRKSAPQVCYIHKSPGVNNNLAPEAPRKHMSPVAVRCSRTIMAENVLIHASRYLVC